jgi:hypothetical protein
MKLSNYMTQEIQKEPLPRKNRSSSTDLQLRGFWLHLGRGSWIVFLLAELMVIIISLLGSDVHTLTLCPFPSNCTLTPDTVRALHLAGITPGSYLVYNLVLTLVQSLVFLGTGVFIFWRKSRELPGLVTSFVFVILGLSPIIETSTHPAAVVFGYIWGLFVVPAIGFFLLTFPNGRFVPRWSWVWAALWVMQTILFEIPDPLNITLWPPLLFGTELLLTYGGTLALLIYRYVRVFSYSQRQQTKWLVFGLSGFVGLILLYFLIGNLIPGLAAPDSPYQLVSGTLLPLTFLTLPLSVAIAIQRTRLWEIDVLIRRTLVYSTLTLLVVLLYWGLVLAFGSLVRGFLGQQQNPLVIVASTLVIAVLFQPLRHGIQRVIDRRFYRRKYDAAKIVEAFSTTLRNEVDLDQLREQIVTVVQETMQPVHISLWLRPTTPDRKGAPPWSD